MATLQAATASRGAHVTDAQAVRQFCDAYCFGMLKWEVTDTGEFSIWGYDAFDVYEADDEGIPDYEAGIATRSFLHKLSEYIASDAELDIQTAGYTKFRFPVYAQRYVVREDEILHSDLGSLETIDGEISGVAQQSGLSSTGSGCRRGESGDDASTRVRRRRPDFRCT